MRRIGILGGTFDPVHIGHLIAADQALFYQQLDEIWFMPAPVPPHKQNEELTAIYHRVEMLKEVAESSSKYKLCTIELDRPGPSYTVDTMKELTSIYPTYSFYFIIGGDMIKYLPKWHGIEELLKIVTFIGLNRPGFKFNPKSTLEKQVIEQVKIIPMPQLEISSSQIRDWLKLGRSVRYLVPNSVEQYIKEHNLYGI